MRSLTSKLIVLVLVFILVPVILYAQFSAAEREKRSLLLGVIRDEGLLIASALDGVLQRADSVPYVQLGEELARFSDGTVSLKLLFRPNDPSDNAAGFFYVSSAPPVATEDLAAERRRLAEAGILERLTSTCSGEFPSATRVELTGGRSELLTSITPVKTDRGCWVLVVSKPLEALAGVGFGQPYWQSPEIQLAAAVYMVLALVVLGLFLSLWGSLRRFGRLARSIGVEGNQEKAQRFADRNTIPELSEVARDFDRMVETLRASAENLRRTAEETAHAFKTPIAIIRQALEPISRAGGDPGVRRNTEVIAAAAKKLDGLVQAMRRIDWATADLLDAPRRRVDLGEVCGQALEDYVDGAGGAQVYADLAPNIGVVASDAAIETVVANLVENAISFTPDGGTVKVSVHAEGHDGVLMVEDDGPGVSADRIERIFERYYSARPGAGESSESSATDDGGHFGIGLWIVRRNVEMLGGRIEAANRPEGGLRMKVLLPRA
ncbi:MAG: histidine kinase [Rhodospirillaceae bacterium]|nr:histidine kinase [Rhodospirillaceae bacterium]